MSAYRILGPGVLSVASGCGSGRDPWGFAYNANAGFSPYFGPILGLHAGFEAVDVAVLDWIDALLSADPPVW